MKIHKIVIHCSDSPQGRGDNAETIHRWHTSPDKPSGPWAGIGYHYVILEDGRTEHGRPDYWTGAHTRGHNRFSLGICLIGRDEFTDEQYAALEDLLRWKVQEYPGAIIEGHYQLDPGKTCPNFDVPRWLASVGLPR